MAQSAHISIDENFLDWGSHLVGATDPNDVTSGLDLFEVQVTHDQRYLYVRLETAEEFDLTDNLVDQDLWLHLDTDNDPNTGFPTTPQMGSELSIAFKGRYAWFNIPNPSIRVGFESFGFRSAPTVTSSNFELAIDRLALPNGVDSLFIHDTIGILFEDKLSHDFLPDSGSVVKFGLEEGGPEPFPPADIYKGDTNHLRLVSYNVLMNGGWVGAHYLDEFTSIVRALDADVYAFQESRGTTIQQAKDHMNDVLPISGGWYAVKDDDVITVSRWPILQQWNMWRQMACLIDLPDKYEDNLLVINAHLSCCGADANRQNQVDELAAFILDAKSSGGAIDLDEGTPIVYCGDLNLVGFAQQLNTVLTGDIQDTIRFGPGAGPDWDGTDLKDATPYHTDQSMVYTWRSQSSGFTFPPGRLDFQIFTDSEMEVKKSFILQTEIMDGTRLYSYGLDSNDTKLLSDHLPVVVDYSLKMDNVGILADKAEGTVLLFPNPTSGVIRIVSNERINSVKVLTIDGGTALWSGSPSSSLDLTMLNSGMYMVEVYTSDARYIRRVVVR